MTRYSITLALLIALAGCGAGPNDTASNKATNEVASASDHSTPDGLARILLKALQENDEQVWVDLTHPSSTFKEAIPVDFERKRQRLIEQGLTDWASVEFDLVKYNYDGFTGKPAPGVATFPIIEFTSGEGRFMGTVRFGAFKLHEGRYLLWSTDGSSAGFGRVPVMPGR